MLSLLFLFTGKEKEAKRKAARANKIKVQNLKLQALAEALLQGQGNTQRGALRQPQRSPTFSLRCSQKHPTGMFLMGSPCVPLAPARRAFQLQTAAAVCHQKTRRPSSRVPPSVQGEGLPTFFFSFKKKVGQRKMRPSERSSAFCGRRPGALPPRLPCKPLKRLDRNFTGLRPCWLRLQAVTFALRRVKAP